MEGLTKELPDGFPSVVVSNYHSEIGIPRIRRFGYLEGKLGLYIGRRLAEWATVSPVPRGLAMAWHIFERRVV